MVPKSPPKKKSKEESQFAKTFWRVKMTFWAVSSQAMKNGSTKTTLKLSGKLHNGRLPIPHDKKVLSVQIKSQNNVPDFFILEGLFFMNLYQLDKQSTKFTIWKYLECCVKKLDGNHPKFCQQLMDLASRQCTCSHGTVCEGYFSYRTNNCVGTPCLFTGSSPQ